MEVSKIVDEEQFKKILSSSNKVLVFDFFATWCGPCKMLSPIIEEVANQRDDAVFYKVDVDENYDLAKSFAIMSVPTVLFFKDEKLVNKCIGLISQSKLNSIIDEIV